MPNIVVPEHRKLPDPGVRSDSPGNSHTGNLASSRAYQSGQAVRNDFGTGVLQALWSNEDQFNASIHGTACDDFVALVRLRGMKVRNRVLCFLVLAKENPRDFSFEDGDLHYKQITVPAAAHAWFDALDDSQIFPWIRDVTGRVLHVQEPWNEHCKQLVAEQVSAASVAAPERVRGR